MVNIDLENNDKNSLRSSRSTPLLRFGCGLFVVLALCAGFYVATGERLYRLGIWQTFQDYFAARSSTDETEPTQPMTTSILFPTNQPVLFEAESSFPGGTVTPIPKSLEPGWLAILYPKPGAQEELSKYRSGKLESHSGSLGSPGQSDAICIQIWPSDLLDPGDDWEYIDVANRTFLFVDGRERSRIEDYGFDGIVLHYLYDDDGAIIGRAGGPYSLCFRAVLGPGLHYSELIFTRSLGGREEYSWTFELVEGTKPTSTPLPPPISIDGTGEFPPLIWDVLPRPGEVRSISDMNRFKPRDKEEWEMMFTYSPDAAGKICFGFFVDQLYQLGEFPYNDRDWLDQIFLQIDSQRATINQYPNSTPATEDGSARLYCASSNLNPGNHVASLYFEPLGGEIFSYSWSFTIID